MHTWIQGITTPGHEITLKGEEEGGGGVEREIMRLYLPRCIDAIGPPYPNMPKKGCINTETVHNKLN